MAPLKVNSLTEKDLIKGCLKGQRTAQRALFDMYAGKMLVVCHRYARTTQEAEDILQDAFIKVFKFLNTYDHAGSFEGWIRKIVINTALKLVSKKSFQNEEIGLEPMHQESEVPEIYAKLNLDELLALVQSMPDGYRTIFNMFAIEGYSHQEIATQLNIAESTSRSQLLKARKYLQSKLSDLQRIAI